ncbi:MAG: cell division protein CrgA [Acidimicrobiales bacterium]
MPESKKRKKAVYTPPPVPGAARKRKTSPPWLAPVMMAMFLIGIVWLVVFYLTQGDMPVVGALSNWNLVVGFGFIVVGFALSTQWR